MDLENLGEELRVLYVAMTRAKEKLILTASDKNLESKLEKWKESLFETEGGLPFTLLSLASSYLDWILMAIAREDAEPRQRDDGEGAFRTGDQPSGAAETDKGYASGHGYFSEDTLGGSSGAFRRSVPAQLEKLGLLPVSMAGRSASQYEAFRLGH